MPVTPHWDNEAKSIIRFEFTGDWTWDEMIEAIESTEAMHAEVPHNVIRIYDVSQSKRLPSGAYSAGKTIAKLRFPNSHSTFIGVGANPLVRTIANSFMSLFGKHYGFDMAMAADLEQARAKALEILAKDAKHV